MDFLSVFDENINNILQNGGISVKKIVLNESSPKINKSNERKKNKLTKKALKFLRFNSANSIPQNFPFRSTFIKYILENQNLSVHRKLKKSCKYFVIGNPSIICHNLISYNSIKSAIKFSHETITIGPSYFSLPFSYSYQFSIETIFKFCFNGNRLALSQIIQSINKCTAKDITIHWQNLSFNELKMLIGGNVKKLELIDVNIGDNDKNDAITRIIKLIPNVQILKLSGFLSASFTFESLTNFTFNQKLSDLYLEIVIKMKNFNVPKYLAKFLINNISKKGLTRIEMKSEMLWDEIQEEMCRYYDIIQNDVNSHFIDEKEKPRIDTYFYSR